MFQVFLISDIGYRISDIRSDVSGFPDIGYLIANIAFAFLTFTLTSTCIKLNPLNKDKQAQMNRPTIYSIGELAKEFDITTRSIRFYEDQGLLAPQRQGQTRLYTNKDRVRLKLILRGKRLGFSLSETKNLFDLYDMENSSARQLHTVLALIDDKKMSLKQQLEDIKVLLVELGNLEERCRDELAEIENSKASTNSAAPNQETL
jgi:DNA-binding transcriptional MerR regulator